MIKITCDVCEKEIQLHYFKVEARKAQYPDDTMGNYVEGYNFNKDLHLCWDCGKALYDDWDSLKGSIKTYYREQRNWKVPIEYTLNIDLTPLQRRYWNAVSWLVEENPRAVGRTFLLAVAFIGFALEHPGKWIRPWDHYMYSRAIPINYLIDTIRILVNKNKILKDRFEYRQVTREFRILGENLSTRGLKLDYMVMDELRDPVKDKVKEDKRVRGAKNKGGKDVKS